MNKYFMEEVLVIVDVQSCFEFAWPHNYVKNIFKLARQYKKVYQIWDDTSADGPTWRFPNQKKLIKKTYGGELTYQDIHAYKWKDNGLEELELSFKNEEFYSGDVFHTVDGMHFIYVGGNHPWFIIENEFIDFFLEIEKNREMVHFVGGARGECLYDVEICAETCGVSFKILYDYVY